MISRPFFIEQIEKAWKRRPLVWLKGVRRVGKTTLARSLSNVQYFDCELPRTAEALKDPEGFLGELKGKRIILDEIHRLADPSNVLKVATDHFPSVKVLATGSSTLGASAKFKDSLAGRKTEVFLTPVLESERALFGGSVLEERLRKGGLPPFLTDENPPPGDYEEWLDAYFARDVMELFRTGKRASFLRFAKLVFARSGGIFDASKFGRECEADRRTITTYLGILEETHVVHVLRPYSSHRPTEIVSAPKIMAFDTGFMCHYRGWTSLRREDMGLLWEHYVLNELQARLQTRQFQYWRDKKEREVDLIWAPPGKKPTAIECKWSAANADTAHLETFASLYPGSRLVVVARDVDQPYRRKSHGLEIEIIGLEKLVQGLALS
jgi:hypothetical protein